MSDDMQLKDELNELVLKWEVCKSINRKYGSATLELSGFSKGRASGFQTCIEDIEGILEEYADE